MRQYIDEEKEALITSFDNNVDLYNYIRKRIKEKGKDHWAHIAYCTGGSWCGGINFEQAMSNLLFGDKDTTAKFLDGLKENNNYADKNTSVFLDVEGFAYDMGAVVSGEPESCFNFTAPESKRTINICIDFSFCDATPARALRYRGIAIVNLINTLIAKGYILNIKMVKVYNPTRCFEKGGIKLTKEVSSTSISTENLCIGTMGMYCSVEFFRIIMILADSMMTEQNNNAGDGRGSRTYSDYYKFFGEDMFLIPGGYIDSRANGLDSQSEADCFISNLFNEYCERNNLVLE